VLPLGLSLRSSFPSILRLFSGSRFPVGVFPPSISNPSSLLVFFFFSRRSLVSPQDHGAIRPDRLCTLSGSFPSEEVLSDSLCRLYVLPELLARFFRGTFVIMIISRPLSAFLLARFSHFELLWAASVCKLVDDGPRFPPDWMPSPLRRPFFGCSF